MTKKFTLALFSFLFLAACVENTPVIFMPDPPKELMQPPKKLKTIKPIEKVK